MLILITGISTAGKSTIMNKLRDIGYESYDTDRDAGGAWYHKITNNRDGEYGNVPERTKEWFDSHEWRVSMDWVNDIAEQAKNRLIILCGGGANEKEIVTLCDKIIWLKTDEETIKKRVNIPRDHTYGTRPHELAAIIEGNQRKEKEYEQLGATIIDVRRPLDEIIQDILSTINPHE